MISGLQGKRVMLVEDEVLLLMALEDIVEDLGCTVATRAMSVASAVQMARDTVIDLAILDINLRGERVTPAAEILSARGVPFIVASGYGLDVVPSFGEQVRIGKPYSPQQIHDAMIAALALPLSGVRCDLG